MKSVFLIMDLDELQGLTPQMVREWLLAQGFDMRLGGLLHAGRYLVEWEPIESAWRSTEASLYAVAQYRNQSVQSLLREINPRMRKGMPSDAALAEHDEWIVCTPFGATFIAEISYGGSDDGFSIMMPPINDHCDAEFIAEKHWPECLFWPCDEHGNKVRWPEKDGVML